ncbi:hypothetical protein K492DRAFT_173078 [Lichtheimia hyalospora FSU 10163]|nr:hypothetical protein K492DRAFT_173078 [Lichtheimia hyalospora FSU 10163]
MSTIDTSSQQQPIDHSNKPSTKWKNTSMSSTSTSTTNTQKPPRKVDRELQRIKSLAVVSGLNRQFSQEPQSMSPIPSISTTTSISASGGSAGHNHHYHHHHHVPHRPATVCGLSSDMRPYGTRSQRSSSISSSHSRYSTSKSKTTSTMTTSNQRLKKTIELDELEKELLSMFEQAYLQRSQEQRVDNWVVSVMPPASDLCSVDDASHMDDDTPPASTPPNDARVAKRSSSRLSLGRDSIISEVGQQQRIRELESLYMATLKKLNQSEQNHTQWEQHIQQTIAAYIEEKEMEADRARQLAKVVVKQELLMEQMELHMHQVTAAASGASTQLHFETIEDEEQAKHTLHQLKTEIQELRDTRTSMENDISVLRRELDAEQRLLEQTLVTSQTLTAECNEQRVQITEKLDTLKRQVMDKDMLLHKVYLTHRDVVPERPARNSNRDSKQQQPQQQRRSTASPRWTGVPLPPQAPPPTDPLPPVPLSPPPQQQPSEDVLSNSSKRPSISSSAGGASSCFEDPETEAAYREFAEQLQSRLSVSKEIDDLRVWQPADLDEFQKRMSRWSDMDEEDLKRHSLASSLRSKEGAAFWRGMKKKLRV